MTELLDKRSINKVVSLLQAEESEACSSFFILLLPAAPGPDDLPVSPEAPSNGPDNGKIRP